MTIDNIITGFNEKFGESGLEPTYKIMVMWLLSRATDRENPTFIAKKKEIGKLKKAWSASEYALHAAESSGTTLQAQIVELIEQKRKQGKTVTEEKAKEFVFSKYFGDLTKKIASLKYKSNHKDLTEYMKFLKKLIVKMGEVERKKKKFTLKRLPSQVVKDFRWALVNCISQENNEDLFKPDNEIRTLEDLLEFSKSTSLRELHRNIKAIDYLLGSDRDARGTQYNVEDKAKEHLPDYVQSQLSEIIKCGGPEGSRSDKFFSSLLEKCFVAGGETEKYEDFVTIVLEASQKLFAPLSGPEDNFMKACEYEAVNALIAGDLHRLDPVNGDASCQFRVPFIADLYAAVKNNHDSEALSVAATEYKSSGLDVNLFMAKTSQSSVSSKATRAMDEISKGLSHKHTKFDWNVPDIKKEDYCPPVDLALIPNFKKVYKTIAEFVSQLDLDTITGFSSRVNRSLEDVWKTVGETKASYMTTKFERIYFSETSTLRYLTLCRALTVKRLSFYDEFYVTSHVKSLEFPVMTETDMQEIYVELAWYSTAYIKAIFAVMVDRPNRQGIPEQGYLQHAQEDERYHLCAGLIGEGNAPVADHLNRALQVTEWYYVPKIAAGNVIAYYENKRLLYMYLFVRQMPIIMDLRRIIATPNDDDFSYAYSGGGVYYFKPCPDTKRFVYVPDNQLTTEQREAQGLCIEGYSMMVDSEEEAPAGLPDFAFEKDYSEFENAWLAQTDLIDQILVTTMTHPAATGSTVRRSNDSALYHRILDEKAKRFTKLTKDDVSCLYSQSRVADISGIATELTGENRGFLPLFANSYGDFVWGIKEERALIKKISENAGYKGYLYTTSGKNTDGENYYTRSAVTYLLTCRHLYVSSVARKKAHYEKFSGILRKPEEQRHSNSNYIPENGGIDGNKFMD